MEMTRTILKEYIKDGEKNVLTRGYYSITACRLPGSGGFECARLEAIVLDDHYLLAIANTLHDFSRDYFGVVDIDKKDTALSRLYSKAVELANERAKNDNNKVIDITSNGGQIPKSERVYVEDMLRREIS